MFSFFSFNSEGSKHSETHSLESWIIQGTWRRNPHERPTAGGVPSQHPVARGARTTGGILDLEDRPPADLEAAHKAASFFHGTASLRVRAIRSTSDPQKSRPSGVST